MNFRILIMSVAMAATAGTVWAKLPPPSDEAKAKAAEAKAKADVAAPGSNRRSNGQTGRSFDAAGQRCLIISEVRQRVRPGNATCGTSRSAASDSSK